MSNFAVLRDSVLRATKSADSLKAGVAFDLFDRAYDAVKADESKVAAAFEELVHAYLKPPASVPVSVPQPPVPAPASAPAVSIPMLKLDAAALVVIVDALNCGSLFNAQARMTVRDELIAEMRKAGMAIGVKE